MGKPTRFGELELTEDIKSQEREWRFERVGWAVMALLLLCGLAGLLGPGPLAEARAVRENLSVQYNRFARYKAPAELKILCRSPAGQPLAIWIDQEFLDAIEPVAIHPEPEKVSASENRQTFLFNIEGSQLASVTVHFEPNKFGRAHGALGLVDGPSVQLKQFFWP
jgi:hypothetical protein